jgi:hypothetical protein
MDNHALKITQLSILSKILFFTHTFFLRVSEYPISAIFSKIRKDVCNSRCTTSVNETGIKFAFAGQFAAGINESCEYFREFEMGKNRNDDNRIVGGPGEDK